MGGLSCPEWATSVWDSGINYWPEVFNEEKKLFTIFLYYFALTRRYVQCVNLDCSATTRSLFGSGDRANGPIGESFWRSISTWEIRARAFRGRCGRWRRIEARCRLKNLQSVQLFRKSLMTMKSPKPRFERRPVSGMSPRMVSYCLACRRFIAEAIGMICG